MSTATTVSETSSKRAKGPKRTALAKQSQRKCPQNVSTYDSTHLVGKSYVKTDTMPVPSYRPLSSAQTTLSETVTADAAGVKVLPDATGQSSVNADTPDAVNTKLNKTIRNEEIVQSVAIATSAASLTASLSLPEGGDTDAAAMTPRTKAKMSNSHDERKAAKKQQHPVAKRTASDSSSGGNTRSSIAVVTDTSETSRLSGDNSTASPQPSPASAGVQSTSPARSMTSQEKQNGGSADTAVKSSNLSDAFADWTSPTPTLSEQVQLHYTLTVDCW